MEEIRLICRNSRLSVIQAQEITTALPNIYFKLLPVQSYGDKHKELSLIENTIADIFTKELDEALLNGEADIAVHSAKDLPYPLHPGLEVIALTKGLTAKDVLVSKDKRKLADLPLNAKIGTSSAQRKDQLLKLRSDLHIVSIRGTIDERLELVENGEVDALIVAECALKRLDYEHKIAERLPFETHPLQGKLAIVAKRGNAKLKSYFHEIDVRKKYGKVSITGFGPGNPDLLTLRALSEIESADIIFYDDLIDSSFLMNFTAEKIYVGKRKDNHSKRQEDINELLYQSAINGKKVVRLKGGDPLIFGRGGEEYDYLSSRLVQAEIVPGITSALAAAASSAIPLTLREESASVAFCTGYPTEKITVPTADTLVYYMGATNLKAIAQKLIEAGRLLDTPVALIQNASSPTQKVVFSSIRELSEGEPDVVSPLIAIVGNYIKPKATSANNKILVTGSNPDEYQHLGEVVHTPLIQIISVPDYSIYKPVLNSDKNYDWLIFTSRYAVPYFIKALLSCGKDLRWFGNSKIIAIGQVTAKELQKHGLVADIVSENETSDGLVDLFVERQLQGKRILIPRSDLARDIIPNLLNRMGYEVDTIAVYQNVVPDNIQQVNLDDFDMIAFSSPSGVKNFKRIYEKLPSHISVLAKGDVTRRSLYDTGLLQHDPEWVI